MLSSPQDAAETLSRLESLRLRTLADAHRRAWAVWLFWAAVYVGGSAAFLSASDTAISIYWICAVPVASALTVFTVRRLPRRDGVVPPARPLELVGGVVLITVCFLISVVSLLGPWLAVAVAIVAFRWVWPRRLAVAMAGLLATTAVLLVLLLDDRDAAAATSGAYAAVFVAYALYERRRLNALR